MFCPSDAVDFNPEVFNILYPPPKIINLVGPATQMFKYLLHHNKSGVKQSIYRPGQAHRVPENLGYQISKQSVHEGGRAYGCQP
jgi:hypothetical protein